MYIGSSIGNFSPQEARAILRNPRSELRAGDALLLGTDMVKDEATLVRAYDDRDGVTAAFTGRDAPGKYTRSVCKHPGRATQP
jgi:L-histidine Nalpha-methyltransferase